MTMRAPYDATAATYEYPFLVLPLEEGGIVRTDERVTPESVGVKSAIAVSDQAGRLDLLSELNRLGIESDPNDPRLPRLLRAVKEREARGYAYEAADASFELLARSVLGGVPEFFDVEGFHVGVERKIVAPGVTYSASQAVVKIRIGKERRISAAEGDGPFNALDLALRKDLGVYQKHVENLELRDYGVCVFQGGAEAVTRVLMEFGAGAGETWSTVGVSVNIIDASLQALVDAIVYRLVKLGVPAQ
jgi:2-isopropylmalate synthase